MQKATKYIRSLLWKFRKKWCLKKSATKQAENMEKFVHDMKKPNLANCSFL